MNKKARQKHSRSTNRRHEEHPANVSDAQGSTGNPSLACAEDNPWTSILPAEADGDDKILAYLRKVDPSRDALRLSLKQFVRSGEADDAETDIAKAEYHRLEDARRMSFHTIGCSGDPDVQAPQAAVADAMIASLNQPDPPAFCFHLGDIVYKDKQHEEVEDGEGPLKGGRLLQLFYSNEFYGAYRGYSRPIFAIPGNHDGKYKTSGGTVQASATDLPKSPMWHFLRSFCAKKRETYPQNTDGAGDPTRPTMTQPYPYFVLETPVAHIVGLYTNVLNGGALDLAPPDAASAEQYKWLVARLKELRKQREEDGRALIVAMHYPPFSGTADFAKRGDSQSPQTPGLHPSTLLANVLLAAFEEANTWPDLVLSAHAHLYQRLTYTVSHRNPETGESVIERQIPFIIAGSGGHSPTEYLWRDCSGTGVPERVPPFDAVLPPRCILPAGHTIQVAAYNDQDFGFLQITIDLGQCVLSGEFRAAYMPQPTVRPGRVRDDVFHVRLDTHTIF